MKVRDLMEALAQCDPDHVVSIESHTEPKLTPVSVLERRGCGFNTKVILVPAEDLCSWPPPPGDLMRDEMVCLSLQSERLRRRVLTLTAAGEQLAAKTLPNGASHDTWEKVKAER